MKFKTKNGCLTSYALACGYIETIEHKSISLELSWNGGGFYDVKAYDFNEHKRLFWESFETLAEARKFFSANARKFKTKRTKIN